MTRYAAHALIALNLALAAVLAWLWLGPGGELRQVKWVPPAVIKPDFSAALPAGLADESKDLTRMAAVLERPLFSPSRRPAPAAAAVLVAAAPPPDPLGNVVLLGLYAGAGSGGIIATVDGATKRMAIDENIGGWTLKSINGGEVRFVRGAESRVVPLLRNRPAVTATSGVAPMAGASATPTAAPQAMTKSAVVQAMEDETRDRMRIVNETLIKAGLKPVPPH
jgi:hypothetical protein